MQSSAHLRPAGIRKFRPGVCGSEEGGELGGGDVELGRPEGRKGIGGAGCELVGEEGLGSAREKADEGSAAVRGVC